MTRHPRIVVGIDGTGRGDDALAFARLLAPALRSGLLLVHAYGRDGSKVLLPYLDDVHVDVERELGVLLRAWQELRG